MLFAPNNVNYHYVIVLSGSIEQIEKSLEFREEKYLFRRIMVILKDRDYVSVMENGAKDLV